MFRYNDCPCVNCRPAAPGANFLRERTGRIGPVYQLVALVNEHGGSSPRTLRAAVDGIGEAVNTAIRSGMKWTKYDATEIALHYTHVRGQYRFRIDESVYAEAVKHGNVSACKSIETYFEREPWIWPAPVEMRPHGAGNRICVGASVSFERGWWRVTSIHADRVTICLYDYTFEDGYRHREKLVGRRTLTREDVAAMTASSSTTSSSTGTEKEGECGSCLGYGHFNVETGEPTVDKRGRKCGDCRGEGVVPAEATA